MEMQKFAADMYNGKLPIYFKSEPVPTEVRPGCWDTSIYVSSVTIFISASSSYSYLLCYSGHLCR